MPAISANMLAQNGYGAMTWVNDVLRSTRRVARAVRSDEVRVALVAQAEAASELCTLYQGLLLGSEFRRDIENAMQLQWNNVGPHKSQAPGELACLHEHFNEAIALLVEAGAHAEYALDAVRSVEVFISEQGLNSLKITDLEYFFRYLRDAKFAVCQLERDLGARVEVQKRSLLLRQGAVAGVGLALTGLSVSALAVVAGITAPTAAILGAIGSTSFQLAVGKLVENLGGKISC